MGDFIGGDFFYKFLLVLQLNTKIGEKEHTQYFFLPKEQTIISQSPPQELAERLHSRPYRLVLFLAWTVIPTMNQLAPTHSFI